MKSKVKIGLVIMFFFVAGIVIGNYDVLQPDAIMDGLRKEAKSSGSTENEEDIFPESDVTQLMDVNPQNIDSFRTQLNDLIFGTKQLPELLPESITEIEDDAYFDLDNLSGIESFEVVQNYGIKSVGYIFHPEKSNKRLLLYHQGHRGDFVKGKETIKNFVEGGYTVYAFCMPLLGKNNNPMIVMDKLGAIHLNNHERLKYLEYPIQYFITPVVAMINYAAGKNFTDINMVGISGGGWTTTLCAAVDTRIKQSFPVAGTYPMFIRLQKPKKNYGDFEQTYEKLYSRINYLDMYVMGSVGEGRSQLQLLNEFDSCCFDGGDHEKYTARVSARVEEFKNGRFDVFVDSSHEEHKISEIALKEISKNLLGK